MAARAAHTFAGTDTGAGTAVHIERGKAHVELRFTGTGTMKLQRARGSVQAEPADGAFDDVAGEDTHTAALDKILEEAEAGAWYRWNCSAHGGSGAITGIIEQ